MYSLKELQKIIGKEIDELQVEDNPKGLYEPIQYVLAIGGKRIRPALCLWAYQLFNLKKLSPEIIYPALGLEIFHNFTLLHDDVMDSADIRRNQPTVHVKWDSNTAILSGDAMMIKAYQYMSMCPRENLSEVMAEFSKLALGVCEGQQYDMEFEQRDAITVDEYLEMIRLKTSVLIAGSLKIGAIIGGASSEEMDLLYEFGENIGIAFQIQDDYLDVYGDTVSFGKSIGGDIVNNKKTFLLLQALQKADGSLKEELKMWLNIKEKENTEKVDAVRAIYDKLNIRELSQKLMSDYFNKAIGALETVSVDNKLKADLKQFAINLIDRAR